MEALLMEEKNRISTPRQFSKEMAGSFEVPDHHLVSPTGLDLQQTRRLQGSVSDAHSINAL